MCVESGFSVFWIMMVLMEKRVVLKFGYDWVKWLECFVKILFFSNVYCLAFVLFVMFMLILFVVLVGRRLFVFCWWSCLYWKFIVVDWIIGCSIIVGLSCRVISIFNFVCFRYVGMWSMVFVLFWIILRFVKCKIMCFLFCNLNWMYFGVCWMWCIWFMYISSFFFIVVF